MKIVLEVEVIRDPTGAFWLKGKTELNIFMHDSIVRGPLVLRFPDEESYKALVLVEKKPEDQISDFGRRLAGAQLVVATVAPPPVAAEVAPAGPQRASSGPETGQGAPLAANPYHGKGNAPESPEGASAGFMALAALDTAPAGPPLPEEEDFATQIERMLLEEQNRHSPSIERLPSKTKEEWIADFRVAIREVVLKGDDTKLYQLPSAKLLELHKEIGITVPMFRRIHAARVARMENYPGRRQHIPVEIVELGKLLGLKPDGDAALADKAMESMKKSNTRS